MGRDGAGLRGYCTAMLCKVTVGRDVYVGTPEEVVGFLARAEGAPGGGVASDGHAAYMEGVAARLRTHGRHVPVDRSSPEAFLRSLAAAKLLTYEPRGEPDEARVDVKEVLGDRPVGFSGKVRAEDLWRDVFGDEAP